MKIEHDGPLLRKVKLAVRVVETGNLSLLARTVFVELLLGFHNTREGQCNPRVRVLAGRIGRDEKRVRLAIRELVSFGVLTAKRTRGASHYGFPGLIAATEDRAFSPALTGRERALAPGLDWMKTPTQERAKSRALNNENLNQKIEPSRTTKNAIQVALELNGQVAEDAPLRESRAPPERSQQHLPDHRSGQATARSVIGGDRGRYEAEIAGRLGPNGFEILMGLPLQEVDQLCALQRAENLSDRALEEIWGRHIASSEPMHQTRVRRKSSG